MNLFWQITAVEALLNVAIFAVAVIAYGIVREHAAARNWSAGVEQAVLGGLFGGATALATLVPLHVDGGAAIGAQSVLIALTGPITGGFSTLVALAIAELGALEAPRLIEAGATLLNAGSFLAAALAAFLFQLVRNGRFGGRLRNRTVQLALLAILSSAGSLGVLALAAGAGTAIQSALPATGVNLAATLILGTLLLHERRRHEAEADLRTSAERLTEVNERLVAETQELIVARDAAEQSSRAKSAFLANMSHELRTPLNAVIGFSQLIGRDGTPTEAKRIEYAHDIENGGLHLLGLINDILDFSKAEAGELEIDHDDLLLNDVLDFSVRMMRPQAERAKVALTAADHTAAFIFFGADQRRMRQIILNLLSNAIKFTPPGGTITVGLSECADGSVELVVRDTGIGISDSDRERVFEPFFQVEEELTRSREGTGLGLPLTKRLIELHGGTLKLESVLGAGTAVHVIFPAGRVRIEPLPDAPLRWRDPE
jgi:signal transduction histidine kinase